MDDRLFWLTSTLVELADIRDEGPGETAYCRRLAERVAQLLAPADVAVLMADGSGALTAVAASTERGNRLASLDADRGEGPAACCHGTGRPVLNEPLDAAGERWPGFAAAARAAGFGIVSALPISRHDETVGVISVLAAAGHRLGVTEIRLAQALAEAAAVAVLQQRTLRTSNQLARQLQHALDSRILIEQAKGALAARLDITPEAAFGLLRGFARRHGRLLADVASATVRGELRTQDLLASGETGRLRKARRQPVQRA